MRKTMTLMLFALFLGCTEENGGNEAAPKEAVAGLGPIIGECEIDGVYAYYGEEGEPPQNGRLSAAQVGKDNFEIHGMGRITGYSGPGNISLTIPPVIDGVAVTAIGAGVFRGLGLTNVSMPNTITYIAHGAFDQNLLSSVELPDALTSIGNGAFALNQLTSVAIPDGVTHIDSGAFTLNQLTSVVIPDSVTSIGMEVFANNLLTHVTIPRGITSISDWSFEANRLTSITMHDDVVHIGWRAFADNQLTAVVIPNSVRIIDRDAFAGNPLANITIGANVVTGGGVIQIGDRDDPSTAVTFFTPAFDNGFDDFYLEKGRQAGTYVFSNGAWSME